jgi:two-component system alkaline phosphatase synthesis response regulator PhoP
MKPLIYVVEDDLNIQNVIKIALENAQYNVVCFDNGKAFLDVLVDKQPHLILLDIMLPGMDGIDIITRIKRKNALKEIPIMIVSAKTSELDKVIGLDVGADDYLIKPFGVLELVSRVKALLRRTLSKETTNTIESQGYSLNIKSHELKYQNQSKQLPNKQFELLKYMMEHENQVVSREEILNKIWGYDFVGESRTLDVHIKELRKSLSEMSQSKQHIETIRGVGYKLSL